MVTWQDEEWTDEVRASTTRIGPIILTVHRMGGYDPDGWFATSRPRILDEVKLASKDLSEAKCQAVAILQRECESVIESITSKV